MDWPCRVFDSSQALILGAKALLASETGVELEGRGDDTSSFISSANSLVRTILEK